MRDIKFRLFDGEKMNYNVIGYDYNCGGANKELLAVFDEENACIEYYRIDEELPLMQYTGLKDMNNKDIYEGDIVEAWSEGIKARGEVRQRIDGYWLIYPAYQNGKSWSLNPDNNGNTDVKVIGNIYENPELLI